MPFISLIWCVEELNVGIVYMCMGVLQSQCALVIIKAIAYYRKA